MPLTTSHLAVGLVLSAAFMHALWNAMVKGAADRAVTLGMVMIGHLLVGLAMMPFVAVPVPGSWPFLMGSTFVHSFYCLFLFLAYRLGDLSQVYPIARGIAPVLVACGGMLFAGEFLPSPAWLGIFLVSAGIFSLFLGRNKITADRNAIFAALATGLTIATYSLLDGLGARISGNPVSYIGWLFFLEGFIGFAFLYYRRGKLYGVPLRAYAWGLAGGLISAIAYGLVIYAKTLTSLGAVSAMRESSVIIAALIGVIWFGERPWKLRVAAAVVVATGVLLLAVYVSG